MGIRSTVPRIAKGQDDLASARRSLAKASERLAYAPTPLKKALSRIHTASEAVIDAEEEVERVIRESRNKR